MMWLRDLGWRKIVVVALISPIIGYPVTKGLDALWVGLSSQTVKTGMVRVPDYVATYVPGYSATYTPGYDNTYTPSPSPRRAPKGFIP